MPCSTPSIVVTGAGLAAANGTYIQAGTDETGGFIYTLYTKDGNPASLPSIKVLYNQGPETYSWIIYANIPVFGDQPIYETAYLVQGLMPNCPTDLTFTATDGPWGGSTYLPVPTVTATLPGPDCSNPQERCAYAVGGESGRSRFRRLVSLGYV